MTNSEKSYDSINRSLEALTEFESKKIELSDAATQSARDKIAKLEEKMVRNFQIIKVGTPSILKNPQIKLYFWLHPILLASIICLSIALFYLYLILSGEFLIKLLGIGAFLIFVLTGFPANLVIPAILNFVLSTTKIELDRVETSQINEEQIYWDNLLLLLKERDYKKIFVKPNYISQDFPSFGKIEWQVFVEKVDDN